MNSKTDEDSSTTIEEYWITTIDNPYNPFVEFDSWFAFDTAKQYNTCAYMARIAELYPDLSESDQSIAINKSIDEIIEFNVTGKYKKVNAQSYEPKAKAA